MSGEPKRQSVEDEGKRLHLQRGVYAVEFALVFPVFFLLFYGVLSFGLIFAAQQSLTLAAEDGARATLRYYALSGSPSGSQLLDQLQGRMRHGCAVAQQRSDWLSSTVGGEEVGPSCVVTITGPCLAADGTLTSSPSCSATLAAGAMAGGSRPEDLSCGYGRNEQCQATISLSYAYRARPLLPALPGLAPESLSAKASVRLDPGMLQAQEGGA